MIIGYDISGQPEGMHIYVCYLLSDAKNIIFAHTSPPVVHYHADSLHYRLEDGFCTII